MSLELFFKDIETMSRLRQGMFGQHLDAFAQLLSERGYSCAIGGLHIRLIDDFGRWLKRNHVAIGEISSKHIERYSRYRRRKRQPTGCDASAPKHFVKFLQERGVLAVGEGDESQSMLEHLLDAFGRYLLEERALALTTLKNYRPVVHDFLRDRFGTRAIDFRVLCAGDIVRFVQRQALNYRARAKLMVSALRAFFRYLQYKGHIEIDLSLAVPSVAQWSKVSLPKALSPTQIELLVSSRNGTKPLERRDYAMFLLLARLGLRAGEIVSLTLDDIDWREGCITVGGKNRTWTRLPLPVDVGEAIARYLSKARPPSKLRAIFLSHRAPVTCLSSSALSTRVMHAMHEVGIEAPSRGAHQFRHSLATNMLRNGASLAEIGELLRHRSTHATEVYAKVDLVSLSQLALPWPGGAQ